MTRYIYENGIERAATAEEEAAFDAEETAYANSAVTRALAKLRSKRNKLLIETDWTANSDVTMSSAMTTYRQALRDITNELTTVEQIEAVVFPIKPV